MQKLKTKSKTDKNKYAILLTILALLLVILVYYGIIWQIAVPNKGLADEAKLEPSHESLIEPSILPVLEEHHRQENNAMQSSDSNSVIAPSTPNDNTHIKLTYDYLKLKSYRDFLLNINILVSNFFRDKEYTDQLNKIKNVKLPENIEPIFNSLNEYNEKFLISPNYQPKRIFPINSKLIEKFLKIEQESPSAKEKKDLKAYIVQNLDNFISFFYSDKLQQEFIEN